MTTDHHIATAIGSAFHYSDGVTPRLMTELDRFRILLEDDHARAGTLEGRTVAALMGNHLRAVHRDVVDTLSGETGSFVDLGSPKGPELRLKVVGPTAPPMDVTDPRRGISALYDAVAPSILAGVKPAGSEPQERAWLLGAVLIVDHVASNGGPWGDWNDIEVAYPSVLSPLQITIMRPGTVGTIFSDIAERLQPDHPANRIPGALKVQSFVPRETEWLSVTVSPDSRLYRHEQLPRLDAIERLRIRVELEELLA